MLAVQRDKEKRRRGAHPTELFQLMLGFLLRAALELMKSPTDSLEDPKFLRRWAMPADTNRGQLRGKGFRPSPRRMRPAGQRAARRIFSIATRGAHLSS
jgi:hypothetical protein